jgi:hypothetical protein
MGKGNPKDAHERTNEGVGEGESEVERVRLVSKTSSVRSCASFVYPWAKHQLEILSFDLSRNTLDRVKTQ